MESESIFPKLPKNPDGTAYRGFRSIDKEHYRGAWLEVSKGELYVVAHAGEIPHVGFRFKKQNDDYEWRLAVPYAMSFDQNGEFVLQIPETADNPPLIEKMAVVTQLVKDYQNGQNAIADI